MKNIFENVVENLYDGVYFVDRKRKITIWNKAAEKMTGYSSEEVVGSFCFDGILDHIDSKGNHLCFNGCPLHACMEGREPREAAVYLKRKDGKRVPVVVKAMPIIENDEAALFYFSTPTCNVCKVLKPKVKELIEEDFLMSLENHKEIKPLMDFPVGYIKFNSSERSWYNSQENITKSINKLIKKSLK